MNNTNKERNLVRRIFHEAFNLDFGIFQTFVKLFTNPNIVVKTYLSDDKENYFGPFKYVVLTTALMTFFYFIALDFDDLVVKLGQTWMNQDKTEPIQTNKFTKQFIFVFQKMNNQYSSLTTLFIQIPAMALFTFWFFRRVHKKFMEHFVINTYFMGQVSGVIAIVLLPLLFLNLETASLIKYLTLLDVIIIVYFIYAFFRIFGTGKFGNAVRILVAPFLGYGAMYITMWVISFAIAYFMVH